MPEAEQGEGVSLTIYNQDFVVVRERRWIDLPKGRGSVRFADVAATIVPETVQFTPLGKSDSARVIEQSYEFDLVSADRLFDKFIDEDITVVTRDGGASFSPLFTGLTGTSVEWDTRLAGGTTQGVIRVEASDSIRTGTPRA